MSADNQIQKEMQRASYEHLAERAQEAARRLNAFGLATDLRIQRSKGDIQVGFALLNLESCIRAAELLAAELEAKQGIDGA